MSTNRIDVKSWYGQPDKDEQFQLIVKRKPTNKKIWDGFECIKRGVKHPICEPLDELVLVCFA